MVAVIGNVIFLLGELLRVPLDLIKGIKRRVYCVSLAVEAPQDICWRVASANKIKLANTRLELDTDPDPARPGVYAGVCRYGERSLKYAYQVLDLKPGEAMTFRLLNSECDPVYHFGDNIVGAVALAGQDQSTMMTSSLEVTHTRFAMRLLLPLVVLRGVQALKWTAEAQAGTAKTRTTADQVRTALITGALTFASFFALFGWQTAALLLVVILIHECGHVIAMRWAGIPVRGIYFVPFFGGVAIGDSLGGTEVTRGTIALMGPALSIPTTLLFVFLASQQSAPMLADLALMSALLNGFNLLPILPLDGGQITQALMSRAPTGALRALNGAMLAIGGAIAVWLGDYLLLALLLLVTPSVLSTRTALFQKETLSSVEFLWLASGYAATLAVYLTVTWRLWNMPSPAG